VKRPRIGKKQDYVKTLIGSDVTIGAGAIIICGIKIETYAFIDAGAVVTKDVLEYTEVRGVPAKEVGTVDQKGQ